MHSVNESASRMREATWPTRPCAALRSTGTAPIFLTNQPSTGALTTESFTRKENVRPDFHMEIAMKTPSQFEVCGAPMTMTLSGRGCVESFHRETDRYADAIAEVRAMGAFLVVAGANPTRAWVTPVFPPRGSAS